MVALTDKFDTIHQKKKDTKNGPIYLDYISWSQVADRLDEATGHDWSFEIRQVGTDWVWGKLTIGERSYENIGYAENADQDWKSEVLKDAVSDALKRCAALAGVGRYLYDKDTPPGGNGRAVQPRAAVSSPARPSADDPYGDALEEFAPIGTAAECPIHHVAWNDKGKGKFCSRRMPDGSWCKERP